MAKTERQLEKRKAILEKQKGVEPSINPLDYKVSLMLALNWYNINKTNDDKKAWALGYVTDIDENKKLSRLDDMYFRSVGTLIRIKTNGGYLDDNEETFIINTLNELLLIKPPTRKKTPSIIVETIKQRPEVPYLDKVLEDLETEIDDIVKTGYPLAYKFKITPSNLTVTEARNVISYLKPLVSEIQEVCGGECPQLNEAYSHINSSRLKSFLKKLNDLGVACAQRKVVNTNKKTSTPAQIIANLKFLKECTDIGIKSLPPLKLLDSSLVILYDVKYRKLTFVKPVKGSKLSVNKSTLTNYSLEASFSKIIRKIEDIKTFVGLSVKDKEKYLMNLTSKPHPFNGRLNENTLIIHIT